MWVGPTPAGGDAERLQGVGVVDLQDPLADRDQGDVAGAGGGDPAGLDWGLEGGDVAAAAQDRDLVGVLVGDEDRAGRGGGVVRVLADRDAGEDPGPRRDFEHEVGRLGGDDGGAAAGRRRQVARRRRQRHRALDRERSGVDEGEPVRLPDRDREQPGARQERHPLRPLAQPRDAPAGRAPSGGESAGSAARGNSLPPPHPVATRAATRTAPMKIPTFTPPASQAAMNSL